MTNKKIAPKRHQRTATLAELVADFNRFTAEHGLGIGHGGKLAAVSAYCDAYNGGARSLPEHVRAEWPRLGSKGFYNDLRDWERDSVDALHDGRDGSHNRSRGHFVRYPEHATIAEALIVGNRKMSASDRWLHKLLCEALTQKGLEPLPSLKAVRVFRTTYLQHHERDLFALRAPDRAKGSMRPAVGSMAAGVTRPNQLVELDFSPANVLDVDGRRPSIGTAVDIFTRRRVDVLVDRPSAEAVAQILMRYIAAHGVPARLRIDNGKEFVNGRILSGARAFRIDVEIAPPYSGDRKPFVERAHRTLSDQVFPLLEAYIGRNVAERQSLREEATFAQRAQRDRVIASKGFDRAGLQAVLDDWSVVYHNTPHSGLAGLSPNDVAARHRGAWSRLDPDQLPLLALHFAPPAGRGVATIGKEGLRIEGRDYAAPELFLPHLDGARVTVRQHPTDAGAVMVFESEDRFLCIARNPDLAGIDRAELAARSLAAFENARKEFAARHRTLKRTGPDVQQLALDHLRRTAQQYENVTILANVEAHDAPGLEGAAQAFEALQGEASRGRSAPAPSLRFDDAAVDFESGELRTFSGDDDRAEFWAAVHERIAAGLPVHARHVAWHANNADLYEPGYRQLKEFHARTSKAAAG